MTGQQATRSGSPAISTRRRFALTGRSTRLDARVNAVRHDLADVALSDILFSAHYASAVTTWCTAPSAMLREIADPASVAVSQILHGEAFHVLDLAGEWAWGRCGHDGYVGYVQRALLELEAPTPTHVVTALGAPIFAAPSIKAPATASLPIGARVAGAAEDGFLNIGSGFVHLRHIAQVDALETDPVAVAAHYLGTPYLWGGRGAGGVDCSGLVQQALARCGIGAPRDTDLQRAVLGMEIPEDAALARGDLIFFPGHVGFMADADTLLHANAFWMATVVEPLDDVVARLAGDHAQPILARRRIQS